MDIVAIMSREASRVTLEFVGPHKEQLERLLPRLRWPPGAEPQEILANVAAAERVVVTAVDGVLTWTYHAS